MIIQGDAMQIPLVSNSVQCVVTSPPYWGLRDYGQVGQIGLEPTPEEYVAKIVAVFAEVWRVLRDDGTCWVNLGDSYAGSQQSGGMNGLNGISNGPKHVEKHQGKLRDIPANLKPKDLVGIPWRVAFALQAAGWYLRSDIIWSKPNPMPESVTDRPTKAHEYIFLLTKRERYFFDADAVREAEISPGRSLKEIERQQALRNGNELRKPLGVNDSIGTWRGEGNYQGGRNIRTVWEIATQPYPDAHFATFPEEIAKRCILAGTSERGACKECGAPWERVTETYRNGKDWNANNRAGGNRLMVGQSASDGMPDDYRAPKTTGWQPTCKHDAPTRGCIVLDPFTGSGTVVQVAQDLGRIGIGVDMKMEYIKMARRRSAQLGFGHVFGNNGVASDEVAAAG